ncbi:MAG: excinuclease ABC subunit UvrA [Candidatus Diapherotrites archaeon]|jgi:excinuclease ABC subunit A|uniref:UvrABC system protein A n=1 Tax=Candidatus Iainarchaeum sp. TaxID=3101447 RepID=A0A7K4BYP6_9ARCH|nr:excinuclease ABC subunit UvrA [Candidatus Diapherotrites archaeon]
MKDIVIRGARQHNLKNINLIIPRDKFVVLTGISGSGKSTLAFDTIYAEGQRRYVESLSAYARQFIGVMNKPDVDSIDGLSPAISIEQKSSSNNPRSTVGTVTEIYDYLRLLFARIGVPYCPTHNVKIESQTPEQIAKRIKQQYASGEVTILAPIIRQKKGTYEQYIVDLGKEGFSKVRVDKKIISTTEKISLPKYQMHDIEIVVDKVNLKDKKRLVEAVEVALKRADGRVLVIDAREREKLYSSALMCPVCGMSFEELQPRMFSFNSPFGACEECKGLGVKIEFDPDLIIPDKSLSIIDGAIDIYGKLDLSWRGQQLAVVGKVHGFDLFTPIEKFSKKQLDILLYGDPTPINAKWSSGASMVYKNGWEGLIPQSDRLYLQTESEYRKNDLQKFMKTRECPKCKGKRLKDKVLSVRVAEKSITDITDLSVVKALDFFNNVNISEKEKEISRLVLKEIISRLKFLNDVGLGYLTISRQSGTLSGGEAQRIRLATQIGSNLMGVLYILDEPSIGLHQRDNNKLVETLHKLRDLGNTLLVVEHDEDTIRNADYVVDIGPGAGTNGGKVVAVGTPKEIEKNPDSITGQYLSGKLSIPTPKKRRTNEGSIIFKGCKENNLKNIDVTIPLRVFTCLTGVSGSGKSTLMEEIIQKGLMKKLGLGASTITPGKHDEIIINGEIDKVIIIDQSPIGRTPRSNPATYIKVFDEIRALFAQTKEAKMRGYDQGRFSFNLPGGRCEKCCGDGTIKIEMNFLPDVYVECEECKGKRYNEETLTVTYNGKNIAEVLNMTVEEATKHFGSIPGIRQKLGTLNSVGLGYIKLGQSSTTLSGGEAQRIKLTKELAKRGTGKTLYLLDEPTTGLHFHDIKKLLDVLQVLVDKGNTVVVIEHNLDVIKSADHIIDLGPEGGEEGGEVIVAGTPEEITENKKSYTGKFLKKF